MKQTTIYDIMELREHVRIKEAHVKAISRRAKEIGANVHNMTLEQLKSATEELADLRKDLNKELKFIADAKKTISEFYAPQTVID